MTDLNDQWQKALELIRLAWNEFALEHGYQTENQLSKRLQKKIKQRIYAEPDYISRIPHEWPIIHSVGKNEYGHCLDLFQFVRATTYLHAKYKKERTNSKKNVQK
jgi:hypothetical protein